MLIRLWKICCSLKLTIVFATLATFLLMGGSLLFPGNPQVFATLDQQTLGQWLQNVASYVPALSWWFYAFIASILCLTLNTLCCFIDWLIHIGSRWRKSGEYFIHLGVILMVVGFTWGSLGGWRHIALPCTIGELTALPNWPGHYIAVDKFHAEFAKSGMPTDMISTVRLMSGDQLFLSGEVRINQPILHSGIVITPASFGQQPVGFTFLSGRKTIELRAGQTIQLEGDSRLEVHSFYPDARYDKNGQLQYRTDRLGSPVMELSFKAPGSRPWRGWYFLGQPLPPPLRALNLRPAQPIYSRYSSLTINYDPGAKLSAVGGTLTAFGCLLALISFYRKRSQQDRPEI